MAASLSIPWIGSITFTGVAIGILLVAVVVGLIMYILSIREWAPEAILIRKARKHHKPIRIDCDPGTGESEMVLCEKEKKQSVMFKNEDGTGGKVDPSVIVGDTEPLRFRRGLSILVYGTNDCNPLNVRNALGIETIKQIRQKDQYKAINFLSHQELLDILLTPPDHLHHDCQGFIHKYQPPNPDRSTDRQKATAAAIVRIRSATKEPQFSSLASLGESNLLRLLTLPTPDSIYQWMKDFVTDYKPTITDSATGESVPVEADFLFRRVLQLRTEPVFFNANPLMSAEYLIKMINELREEATKTPIKRGPLAYQSAVKDNPIAFGSVNLATLEMQIKNLAMQDFLNKINLAMIGMIIIGIIGVTGMVIIIGVKALG